MLFNFLNSTKVSRMLTMACVALSYIFSFTSCIDEDLSDCGQNYKILYKVHLHTDLQTELDNQLSDPEDRDIRQKLEAALADVFTDKVDDVELSFYTDKGIAHYEEHTLNASQASFQIYLPVAEYKHHALANRATSGMVTKYGAESHLTHTLQNPSADVLESHPCGIFSGRLSMQVDDKDRIFNVNLHMVNCAAAVVLDCGDVAIDDISAKSSGFAANFMVDDSTFVFQHNYSVNARRTADAGNRVCLYTVNFPSRDNAPSRADEIWNLKVYVKIGDKITENTLKVDTPLRAGRLKVIKANVADDGSLKTSNPNVGVSVQLDWKPGGDWDIPID